MIEWDKADCRGGLRLLVRLVAGRRSRLADLYAVSLPPRANSPMQIEDCLAHHVMGVVQRLACIQQCLTRLRSVDYFAVGVKAQVRAQDVASRRSAPGTRSSHPDRAG